MSQLMPTERPPALCSAPSSVEANSRGRDGGRRPAASETTRRAWMLDLCDAVITSVGGRSGS